jgi:hypothetical protein
MLDYYQKYIKYKTKYLNMKKTKKILVGGLDAQPKDEQHTYALGYRTHLTTIINREAQHRFDTLHQIYMNCSPNSITRDLKHTITPIVLPEVPNPSFLQTSNSYFDILQKYNDVEIKTIENYINDTDTKLVVYGSSLDKILNEQKKSCPALTDYDYKAARMNLIQIKREANQYTVKK